MTSSYLITRHDDILRVGFNKEILAQGDRIVRDAEAQLDALVEAGQLNGGELIKVNGRMSLLVSYTIAHQLVHLYSAIAVFDPRLSAYIVVKSDTPAYPFASRIDANTGNVILVASEVETSFSPASFLLNWEDEVLVAKLNGEVSIEGDRLVRDTQTQLQALIDAGQLPGGKQPLLINGRAPITTGFVIASRVAHLYRTVAVFDPKIGERGLERYVVVIDHGGYRVGETIRSSLRWHDRTRRQTVPASMPLAIRLLLRRRLVRASKPSSAAFPTPEKPACTTD
jgi:CRISPR-associated protein Csx3